MAIYFIPFLLLMALAIGLSAFNQYTEARLRKIYDFTDGLARMLWPSTAIVGIFGCSLMLKATPWGHFTGWWVVAGIISASVCFSAQRLFQAIWEEAWPVDNGRTDDYDKDTDDDDTDDNYSEEEEDFDDGVTWVETPKTIKLAIICLCVVGIVFFTHLIFSKNSTSIGAKVSYGVEVVVCLAVIVTYAKDIWNDRK